MAPRGSPIVYLVWIALAAVCMGISYPGFRRIVKSYGLRRALLGRRKRGERTLFETALLLFLIGLGFFVASTILWFTNQ